MGLSVALIALFCVSFILIMRFGKKTEYILTTVLLICAILSAATPDMAVKKLVIAVISFVAFLMMRKINVNSLIRSSNAIYVTTLAAMLVALLFEPTMNGAHRYIFIGDFAIEPAPFVAFSILPVCTRINEMKRITLRDFLKIVVLVFLEIVLILLLPKFSMAVLMCAVFMIMLIKVKADNRIDLDWVAVAILWTNALICFVMMVMNRPQLINVVLSRGMNDPMGAGFQLSATDTVLKSVRLIGSADLSGLVETTFINRMPILSFAVQYGWICFALLMLSLVAFALRLYRMSNKINNSFARYTCFGISTYFIVGGISHVFCEFVLGQDASMFIFMGTSSNILIHFVLLAIVFALYAQRDKITVGRQLDIDYDMTDAVLTDFATNYKKRLQSADGALDETQQLRARIRELELEQKAWKSKTKTLREINEKYEKYESELNPGKVEKDLVFISYNHFDEKHAAYLAEQIENRGMKAWHFKRDMKSENGTNDYAVAIRRAIRRCRVFVVILSKNSMDSEHVKNEVCLAFNQIAKGTVIMPIVIDNIAIDDDETFGYYLCRQDITNALTPPIKRWLDDFAEKIEVAYQ